MLFTIPCATVFALFELAVDAESISTPPTVMLVITVFDEPETVMVALGGAGALTQALLLPNVARQVPKPLSVHQRTVAGNG